MAKKPGKNIRMILDEDALKYVETESLKNKNEGHPLSKERIIKKGLTELYQQKHAKK